MSWYEKAVVCAAADAAELDELERLGIACVLLPTSAAGADVLAAEADRRGIRVLFDLVLTHTSVDNEWFRKARASRFARERDFFVWSKRPPEGDGWAYDERAKLHYAYRSSPAEPLLDLGKEAVRKEIRKAVRGLAESGASGFRLDGVPVLLERGGPELIDEIHGTLEQVRPDGVLLADSEIAQSLSRALSRRSSAPVAQALLSGTLEPPHGCLTANALERSPRRRELPYSLLFSLPGIPVVRPGDYAGLSGLIAARTACPEIAAADCELLDLGSADVLVHLFRGERRRILIGHNLSTNRLDVVLSESPRAAERLTGDRGSALAHRRPLELRLGPAGYLWVELEAA